MIAKITLFFQLLRPLQWSKNLFVLAPLFFSYRFTDIEAWKYALLSFLCFIVTSSYIYYE